MKIVKEGYPDHTQFNKSDPHYDASSLLDKPKWYMVDVKYVRKTKRLISLEGKELFPVFLLFSALKKL